MISNNPPPLSFEAIFEHVQFPTQFEETVPDPQPFFMHPASLSRPAASDDLERPHKRPRFNTPPLPPPSQPTISSWFLDEDSFGLLPPTPNLDDATIPSNSRDWNNHDVLAPQPPFPGQAVYPPMPPSAPRLLRPIQTAPNVFFPPHGAYYGGPHPAFSQVGLAGPVLSQAGTYGVQGNEGVIVDPVEVGFSAAQKGKGKAKMSRKRKRQHMTKAEKDEIRQKVLDTIRQPYDGNSHKITLKCCQDAKPENLENHYVSQEHLDCLPKSLQDHVKARLSVCCPTCGDSFARVDSLKRHLNIKRGSLDAVPRGTGSKLEDCIASWNRLPLDERKKLMQQWHQKASKASAKAASRASSARASSSSLSPVTDSPPSDFPVEGRPDERPGTSSSTATSSSSRTTSTRTMLSEGRASSSTSPSLLSSPSCSAATDPLPVLPEPADAAPQALLDLEEDINYELDRLESSRIQDSF
ncbi:hypothetical protein EVG20_g8690 [Dentipellis fragilis]|uniref:C2H2-type domain-containing protein n=1 Tax=Dentipellis fragilis TaxID=205917 RepID=A0A4Y9Y4L5_9AGAM|nr:hypothetical protein EVG20_g8690 [Dentipellis fragilis]